MNSRAAVIRIDFYEIMELIFTVIPADNCFFTNNIWATIRQDPIIIPAAYPLPPSDTRSNTSSSTGSQARTE
jgi:hypothetical protein